MLIQRMRDGSSGMPAKIIIGLIIIVFALFGFGQITTFLTPVAGVADVNGEDITQQEMELAVERRRRQLMSRNVPPEEINEDELREAVLEFLVTREVLRQTADDLDLRYGDAAIDAEIVATEAFQLDGVFNPDQFQNLIRGAGYSPLSYRDSLRADKIMEQMFGGIRQSSFLTEEEINRYGRLFSQKRDLAILPIRVENLLGDIIVSDEEIADHYRDNAADFVTEETVDIEYVELKREDLAAGLDVDRTGLEAWFEERRADYSTDETRQLAHILVETSDDVSAEEAEVTAGDIYERIRDGEDFADLAMEFSDDYGSRNAGGDLGFNTQGTFAEEFEAIAYDLPPGRVSEPVQTAQGFHLIKVLEIREAVNPSLDEVREEVESAYKLAKTKEEFVNLSSQLAELLFESVDLEAPASEIGLEIKSTGRVSRESDNPLMANSGVVEEVFSPDVLEDGNNSGLVEINENYHLGLRVGEYLPSVGKPLEEVREDIRSILKRQGAGEQAEEQAHKILKAVKGGSLAQYVADEYGYEWEVHKNIARNSPDLDSLVLREGFKLPRPVKNKESTGHVILPNGDAVVLRVSAVESGADDEPDQGTLAGLRASVPGQLGLLDFQEFENSLKRGASVNRVN